MQQFLPSLLRFFSDEYDEVCSHRHPLLTDLLTLIRRVGTVPPQYSGMLPPYPRMPIILKMRFDETREWGNRG